MTLISKNQEQLYLTEYFTSIQGESSFAGLPSIFIRLSTCNLRCTWCDTNYSFRRGKKYTFSKLFEAIDQSPAKTVCITGGEPLLQRNIYPFMKALCDKNYTVTLETSGSLNIEEVDSRVHTILDIKCPSSNMSHKNYWENLKKLKTRDEIKFVLLNQNDYEWAKMICQKYSLYHTQSVLFSPVHGILSPSDLAKWILKDRLQVRLNLQIHKFIWPENTKGV